MAGSLPKDLNTLMPALADQGIKNVCGCPQRGKSLQGVTLTVASSPQNLTFAALGLENMASATYQVIVQNQSDAADEATVSNKATTGFTITGPDATDVVDILIFGQVAGQLA